MSAAQWSDTFDQEIQRLIDETGVSPEQWKTAGRKTQKLPVGEDIAWWKGEGLGQIVAYESWLAQSNLRIATMPDNKPAVEWGMTGKFREDGVSVQMHVDVIFEAGPGRYMIVDNKTGSRIPASHGQLALYAALIQAHTDIRPEIGAYYMTRQGILTDPESLTPWGIDYWDKITTQVRAAQENDVFVPNVGWQCNGCGVKQFCSAMNGPLKDQAEGAEYVLPDHLSWSQISSWLYCGKQYELTRLKRLQEQPSVWLAAGVAVHKVLENINLAYWEAQQ